MKENWARPKGLLSLFQTQIALSPLFSHPQGDLLSAPYPAELALLNYRRGNSGSALKCIYLQA